MSKYEWKCTSLFSPFIRYCTIDLVLIRGRRLRACVSIVCLYNKHTLLLGWERLTEKRSMELTEEISPPIPMVCA